MRGAPSSAVARGVASCPHALDGLPPDRHGFGAAPRDPAPSSGAAGGHCRAALSGAVPRYLACCPQAPDTLTPGRHDPGAVPRGRAGCPWDGGSNPDRSTGGFSRREFLAVGSILGWLPFLRPKHIELAGARFRIVRNGHVSRRYLLIHGNEETARQVLTRHMQAHQGMAFFIENHTREVAIEGGKLDPNRMFSRAGVQANLRQLNRDWPSERVQAALALLDRGREKLVRALTPPGGGLTIALHNNSGAYSVANEEPISDAGSIREPDNPHAFLLCTDPEDFRKLSASPYNVVLQQHAPKEDDGSLSRLAAARGFRYLNLEVAIGQTTRQKKILDWVEWHL